MTLEEALVGKTVESVEHEHYDVVITFEDGTVYHSHYGGARSPRVEE